MHAGWRRWLYGWRGRVWGNDQRLHLMAQNYGIAPASLLMAIERRVALLGKF
jgi:hypothetical protein